MAIAKDFKTRIGRNLIWRSTEDEDAVVRIRPVKGLRKLQKTGELALRLDEKDEVVRY